MATLTALPSSRAFETHHQFSWSTGNSILSSFLPNPQGQGPLGSALRIAIKLRHQSWLPRFVSSRFSQESGRRRSDDELRGRAIKVVDLLQHAADLGNLDALFVLGLLSLVLRSLTSMHSAVALSYFSFHRPRNSLQILYWRITLLRHMPRLQGMRPRKVTWLSFMQPVTRISCLLIKRGPSCTTRLLRMAKTRLLKWHSGIAIGQESALWKIATVPSNGTVLQRNKASLGDFYFILCLSVNSNGTILVWPAWRTHAPVNANPPLRSCGWRLRARCERGIYRTKWTASGHKSRPRPRRRRDLGRHS